MTRFLKFLERLACTHEVRIIDPDRPYWSRCAQCGKPKRI